MEYLTVFMLSNQDFLPLRKWWVVNPEKAKLIAKHYDWEYSQNLTDNQQKQLIEMSYQAEAIFHINMLYDLITGSLSWKPEDEGFNVPGTISDKNWTYRFKPSTETITTDPKIRQFASPPITTHITK